MIFLISNKIHILILKLIIEQNVISLQRIK